MKPINKFGGQNAELLILKTSGTCSYHFTLNGQKVLLPVEGRKCLLDENGGVLRGSAVQFGRLVTTVLRPRRQPCSNSPPSELKLLLTA